MPLMTGTGLGLVVGIQPSYQRPQNGPWRVEIQDKVMRDCSFSSPERIPNNHPKQALCFYSISLLILPQE